MKQRVAIFGATGSIGQNTLDVVRVHPERFEVVALAAFRQWQALADLVAEFRPAFAVLVDFKAAEALRAWVERKGVATKVLAGSEALTELAASDLFDTLVAAVVGAAGLPSVFAAVASGKKLLLANKEALVVAGAVLMQQAQASGATILPIDSEHNALFQCLGGRRPHELGVRRLILTASGGPFRERDTATFAAITPEEACAHPNWRMGPKISVDSATMMNKGLEVIEARWLFDLEPQRIEVLIHPQSIVHALVEFGDGSVLAQLSVPDMRVPIAHALAWPEGRIASGASWLQLEMRAPLSFDLPDKERFPCLELAYEALRLGGTAPAVLNAANEVAVEAFLRQALRFDRIPVVIAETLSAVVPAALSSLEVALAADAEARSVARRLVAEYGER